MKTKIFLIVFILLLMQNIQAQLDPSVFRHQPLDIPQSQNVNVTVSEKKERTVVTELTLQVQSIFFSELGKYSDFYKGKNPPSPGIPVITDNQTDGDGRQFLVGQYSYDNGYQTPNRSLTFRAYYKIILDEYKITKVTYNIGEDWYRLFPENEDTSTINKSDVSAIAQKPALQSGDMMITNKDVCMHVTDSFNSECILTLPKGASVKILQTNKIGGFYVVKYNNKLGYIDENSLE